MKQIARANRSLSTRRGTILVVAIVCLLVTSMLLVSLVQAAVQNHRQTRRQSENIQARWLAEAGLARAVARLAEDTAYSGETWKVTIDAAPGQVEIRVSPVKADDNQNQRAVRVVAQFPADSTVSAQVTRTTRWQPPAQSSSSSANGEDNP